MGVTSSVFTTATSLMGTLGGSSESSSQSGLYAAYAQAEGFEAEAARREIEAAEAVRIGRLRQAEQMMKGRREIAEGRAAYAAAGVMVDAGSPAAAAADAAAWSEYERQKIEADAAMESWGLKYDAALLRKKAGAVRAAGVAGGSSSSGSGGGAFGGQVMDELAKMAGLS